MDSVDEMFDQISKNNVDSQTRNVTVELDERIKEEMRLGTFSYLNVSTLITLPHTHAALFFTPLMLLPSSFRSATPKKKLNT